MLDQNSPQSATPNVPQIPTEFDAKAEQRVPFQVEYEGEYCEVGHIFRSYDNEDLMVEYARRCPTKLRRTDVKGVLERETESFEANVWLYRKLALGVDGMGEPNAPLPEDWLEQIPDEDQADAITALLATEILPLNVVGKNSGKRLPWGYKATTSTVRLRVRFGAYQLVTEHRMVKANAEQMRRFRKLLSRAEYAPGEQLNQQDTVLPSRARELGKLYRELCESTAGYVDGIVPLNHQVDVVLYHLSGGQEAVIKNL